MALKEFKKKANIYHVYYRRQGAYTLIRENLTKIIIGAVIIAAVAILLKKLDIFHPEQDAIYLKDHFGIVPVHIFLFISEICIGALPPPIFIFWAAKFDMPYLLVFTLCLMSLSGGALSYFIGRWLHTLPKVKRWVDVKFKTQFETLKKFGGLLIAVSTVSPISFPTVAMIAGVVNFPFRTYFLLSLFRFVKFFFWGFAIIQGLSWG